MSKNNKSKKKLKSIMSSFSDNVEDDDNIIIIVASFIADKGVEGATWNEIIDLYFSKGFLSETEKNELIDNYKFDGIHNSCISDETSEKFRNLVNSFYVSETFTRKKDKIYILFDGLMSILDFVELKHAKKNSNEAKKYSSWAIGISIISLFVSIIIGSIQLNSEIKIDTNQFDILKKVSNKQAIDSINKQITKNNVLLKKIEAKLNH